MIRIGKLTDYGIVVMTHLARDPAQAVMAASDLAQATSLGPSTVAKLLKVLLRAGLLVSHRGIRGGYSLSRPAEEISVGQIIGAIEGPVVMTECGGQPANKCSMRHVCTAQSHWHRIDDVVREALESLKLEELARPLRLRKAGALQRQPGDQQPADRRRSKRP
ncbi:MAG: SUF system Fe-S cluster assembly regulator [Deltaproteobacteria bacterium]|nr:SUF system Fe-S cluster assembly regulator [Deltaproteobacteria bacterium]